MSNCNLCGNSPMHSFDCELCNENFCDCQVSIICPDCGCTVCADCWDEEEELCAACADA